MVDYQQVFRVFECGRPSCERLLKLGEDDWDSQQPVICDLCTFENTAQIILKSAQFKYCKVCEQLQPIGNFHKHAPASRSWRSGRQFECIECKNTKINPVLNPLRTPDQHREASERRRFYDLLAGDRRIDTSRLYERFDGKCFKCGKALERHSRPPNGFAIDHTLPAYYLWPLQIGPTLLCHACNNSKHQKWPSEFYSVPQLRALSVRTGLPYSLLAGNPKFNAQAMSRVKENIDEFLERWINHPD
ncbi:MAG: hypothetical protein KGK07_08920, partial [Chloroflexota bacterium]|nr:hypothetical protein [Chloroflexota bacterium]